MCIYILAGNYQQAKLCASKNHLADSMWKYIESPQTIVGLIDGTIWLTGSYSFRSDMTEMKQVIKTYNIVTISRS